MRLLTFAARCLLVALLTGSLVAGTALSAGAQTARPSLASGASAKAAGMACSEGPRAPQRVVKFSRVWAKHARKKHWKWLKRRTDQMAFTREVLRDYRKFQPGKRLAFPYCETSYGTSWRLLSSRGGYFLDVYRRPGQGLRVDYFGVYY